MLVLAAETTTLTVSKYVFLSVFFVYQLCICSCPDIFVCAPSSTYVFIKFQEKHIAHEKQSLHWCFPCFSYIHVMMALARDMGFWCKSSCLSAKHNIYAQGGSSGHHVAAHDNSLHRLWQNRVFVFRNRPCNIAEYRWRFVLFRPGLLGAIL